MTTPIQHLPEALSDGSARPRVDGVLAGLGTAVHDLESRSGTALREFAGSAQQAVRQGADATRERAMRLGESGASYVRERPLRAVAIAAASGAVAVLLLGAITRALAGRR